MDLVLSILVGLFAVVATLDISLNLIESKKRFLNASLMFVISGGVIYYLDITSINDIFSALVVAGFVVSGVYFFYTVATWARKNAT